MYELSIETSFDSAHNLRGYQGSCESLHGHTYRVQVFVTGTELNKLGILVDFRELKSRLNEVISDLDHCYLNEVDAFKEINPTAENIAAYIFRCMRTSVGSVVSKVTVWETATSAASYWE